MSSLPNINQEFSPKPKPTRKDILSFILPSILGILLFIVPIPQDDSITIPIAFMAGFINGALGDVIPFIIITVMAVSVVLTIGAQLLKPAFVMERESLRSLLLVKPVWTVIRAAGLLFAVMVVFGFGAEAVYSEDTGGLLMYDLLPILLTTFLLAGFLLPLLLNFGMLEFIGVLLMKVMQPLFRVPGRSSLDCLTSWVGDGTIGVLLTTKQYEGGYYTKREAAVVATTFSVVSITFTIVIIDYMELMHMFPQYYLTITIAGLLAAVIMPRIPPLSRKADTAFEGQEIKGDVEVPAGTSLVKIGFSEAVAKARSSRSPKLFVRTGLQNVLDMWIGVLPVVMAIGTVALVTAEFTPFFSILGRPFEPLLTLMQVPEAEAAAQTMVVGFADMFLPAIIGSGIESDMTRFIIACVSVTQLVYLSEMGGLLLGSKLPVKFRDLVFIFILRTLITLPIVVLMAHLIF
ncbi:YjiH family protein [Alkalicoccus luteus]|uniref:YjiH family protein n=1 Tax=Alkalicoccus luteus TaxID=1237094 RepID=A0A969PT97_9BACI|nr:YjiH family protein [Alkalicoccus luteus]NJP37503.1 YjiH family protein [Alkalicoccus luteus]